MKQKAQIDIIDISIPESDLRLETEDYDLAVAQPPESPPPGKGRKRLLWFAGGFILVVVASVMVWYLLTELSYEGPKPERRVAVPVAKPVSDRLTLNDFFIEVRDDQGKARILHCGVVLDIDGNKQQDLSSRELEMRKVIFKILGSRSLAVLLRPEERKGLKKEISEELNRLLGPGAVREVNFEKYLIM